MSSQGKIWRFDSSLVCSFQFLSVFFQYANTTATTTPTPTPTPPTTTTTATTTTTTTTTCAQVSTSCPHCFFSFPHFFIFLFLCFIIFFVFFFWVCQWAFDRTHEPHKDIFVSTTMPYLDKPHLRTFLSYVCTRLRYQCERPRRPSPPAP